MPGSNLGFTLGFDFCVGKLVRASLEFPSVMTCRLTWRLGPPSPPAVFAALSLCFWLDKVLGSRPDQEASLNRPEPLKSVSNSCQSRGEH